MAKISYFGNEQLLERGKTAFVCSHQPPDDIYPVLKHWMNTLQPEHDCIVCGTLSGIERLVIRQCVERSIPLIIVLAERMPEHIEDVAQKLPHTTLSTMMGEGRLLIMSTNHNDNETEASQDNAEKRNRWMFNCCQDIIAGYIQSGGRLDLQLIGIKKVKYLLKNTPIKLSAEDNFKRGWSIYHYISNHILNMPSYEIRAKLLHYLQLGIPTPSPLHSSVLFLVTKECKHIGTDFNFPAFFEMWGIDNLREDDWKRYKSKKGTYYDSIAEKALHLLEMAPKEFQRPELTRLLANEAFHRYPNNSHYEYLAK